MWLEIALLALLLLLLSAKVSTSKVRQQEFCQWETFNATCSNVDDVILMTSALYGRMRVGRCLTVDYHVGCYGDVTETVSGRCSGRRTCSVSVPDPELFRLQPCRKDLVAYFEATFRCVHISGSSGADWSETGRGEAPTPAACNGSAGVSLPSASGYLANFVARLPDGPGSPRCPWVLTAPTGQRLNVTLLDFTGPKAAHSGPEAPLLRQSDLCPPLVVLLDPGNADHVIRTCDVRQRKKLVYTSHGSDLRVFILNATAAESLFLLHYQVTGCADLLNLSKDTWSTRSGENLLVSCNGSYEKWHLVCRGSEWVGSYGNCSSATVPHTEEARVNQQQFPIGLLVAIAIGAVVGVAIGCAFLLTAFVFRKRFQRRRLVNEAVLVDLYKSRDSVYKTVDHVHTARPLPPEMTCMLDVIVGGGTTTPPSTAPPPSGGCGCAAAAAGGGGMALVSTGRSGLGPEEQEQEEEEEVYFSEELFRRTLGRCGGGGGGGGSPGGSADGLPGGASEDANRRQVAQVTPSSARSCPHDSSFASADVRPYEEEHGGGGGGGEGGGGGGEEGGKRMPLNHFAKTDYQDHVTPDARNAVTLIRQL